MNAGSQLRQLVQRDVRLGAARPGQTSWPCRHLHRHDLSANIPAATRRLRPPLALRANSSCSLPADPVAAATRSAVSPSEMVQSGRHPRVDEAPADRRVGRCRAACGPRLARSSASRSGARVMLSTPAGNEDVALAGPDRVGRGRHRLKPGAAETVHRLARDLHRQAGRAARPSGRRSGCPRPPDWRSQNHIVDPVGRDAALHHCHAARARRDRRGAPRPEPRRLGPPACARRR